MSTPSTEKHHAVLCARGGSKRLPGKNVALLAGKPMLAYSVESAIASGCFSDVIVNSDSREILDVAINHGAEAYARPAPLGRGDVFIYQVVQEMAATLEWGDADTVSVMFPTVPLRSAEDIRNAFSLFEDHDRLRPVVSVTPFEYPIQTALTTDDSGGLTPVFEADYRRSTRHNDHAPAYRANYGIVINTVGQFMQQTNLIGHSPVPYEMPYDRSIDVDEEYQFRMAELLLKARDE